MLINLCIVDPLCKHHNSEYNSADCFLVEFCCGIYHWHHNVHCVLVIRFRPRKVLVVYCGAM
jgi:hypothetical protein